MEFGSSFGMSMPTSNKTAYAWLPYRSREENVIDECCGGKTGMVKCGPTPQVDAVNAVKGACVAW